LVSYYNIAVLLCTVGFLYHINL